MYSAMSTLADCVKALTKSNEALQRKVDIMSERFDSLAPNFKTSGCALATRSLRVRCELAARSLRGGYAFAAPL